MFCVDIVNLQSSCGSTNVTNCRAPVYPTGAKKKSPGGLFFRQAGDPAHPLQY